MELVPRTTAPLQPTGVVELVPLTAIAGDPTFRLRGEGDVSALAPRASQASISSSAQAAWRVPATRARSASSSAAASGSASRAWTRATDQASSSESPECTRASARSRSSIRSAASRRKPATTW